MTRRETPRTRIRSSPLDGWAWIVVLLLGVLVVSVFLTATPAHAQTDDTPPNLELGGDLYPPTDYPIDDSRGIVDVDSTRAASATTRWWSGCCGQHCCCLLLGRAKSSVHPTFRRTARRPRPFGGQGDSEA